MRLPSSRCESYVSSHRGKNTSQLPQEKSTREEELILHRGVRTRDTLYYSTIEQKGVLESDYGRKTDWKNIVFRIGRLMLLFFFFYSFLFFFGGGILFRFWKTFNVVVGILFYSVLLRKKIDRIFREIMSKLLDF